MSKSRLTINTTVDVSTCVDVDLDLASIVDDLDHDELVQLQAMVTERLQATANTTIAAIFLASRVGDRERVFALASEFSRNVLGRVC
jgi:hypothetical protein